MIQTLHMDKTLVVAVWLTRWQGGALWRRMKSPPCSWENAEDVIVDVIPILLCGQKEGLDVLPLLALCKKCEIDVYLLLCEGRRI